MEINSVVPSGDQDYSCCIEEPDNSKDDHISKLTDDILSIMLSFLTLRDAVRARVLSQSWRYLCAARFNLEFDAFTILGLEYDCYMHDKKLWGIKSRFIRAVDQVLQLCTSSKIYFFRVSYCLGNESATHIDNWIRFAVKMQTERLDLDFSSIPKGCEFYTFPYHLLSQSTTSQLKHLSLGGCALKTSYIMNTFHSLKSLELFYVALDQSAFDDFLSCCVNLESLKLNSCMLPGTFTIGRKLHKLKLLVMFDCDGPYEIGLSSTSLKTFEYMSTYDVSILYVNAPSLLKLHIWFMHRYEGAINYIAKRLGRDFPRIKTLSLVCRTYQPIPAKITKLRHLKELELFVFTTPGFDLVSVASILNAAPRLQKLHLAIQKNSFRQSTEGAQYYTKQFYKRLKKVEISGFNDECNALEAAKYLISHAIGLEQMIITKQGRRYRLDGAWSYLKCPKMDESEKERVYNMLSREKIQPNVEIILS